MKSSGKNTGVWIVIAIVVFIYALFPIASILANSFKKGSEFAGSGTFLPQDPTFENYASLFVGDAKALFVPALINSLGITLIATAISVVLATFAAYAIARLDFPGKRIILTSALAVSIFPVISIVTPLFNLWR